MNSYDLSWNHFLGIQQKHIFRTNKSAQLLFHVITEEDRGMHDQNSTLPISWKS